MLISCDCSTTAFDNRCRVSVLTIRRARKPHECIECGEAILVGKQYEEATGIDSEGSPYRFYTCIGCANMRKHYCPNGWIWGGLREALMGCESVGFDYTTPPSELEVEEC